MPPAALKAREARPRHPVCPREEGGVGTKNRDEAPEEDDLAAMAAEDVAADLQAALVEADVFAVAAKQPIAAPAAEGKADVVTNDRCGSGYRDHDRDVESVRGGGIEGGGDQGGFARERDTNAFKANEREDRLIAVAIDPVAEVSSE